MERRLVPRKVVLMSGLIETEGNIDCLISDTSVSGAALEISNSYRVPERFNLRFDTDSMRIPCRVVGVKMGASGSHSASLFPPQHRTLAFAAPPSGI